MHRIEKDVMGTVEVPADDVILKYGLIDEKDLDNILSPKEMTQPKEPDNGFIFKIKNSENYKRVLEQL